MAWTLVGNIEGPSGSGGAEVPIGSIIAWTGDRVGLSLPSGFVRCDGQTLNDPASPFHGFVIRDLNNVQRFLRGGVSSDVFGGSDTHNHQATTPTGSVGTDCGGGCTSALLNPGEAFITAPGSTVPNYYQVVWIMRIK